jgi:hypothetical protein
VEQTYNCEVAGVFPHSDEVMILGSAGIFVLRHPNHPISAEYRRVANRLMQDM